MSVWPKWAGTYAIGQRVEHYLFGKWHAARVVSRTRTGLPHVRHDGGHCFAVTRRDELRPASAVRA